MIEFGTFEKNSVFGEDLDVVQFRFISIPFELKLINSKFFLIEIVESGHKTYYLPFDEAVGFKIILFTILIPELIK